MGSQSDAIRRYNITASSLRIAIYVAFSLLPLMIDTRTRERFYPFVLALVIVCTIAMVWSTVRASQLQYTFNSQIEAQLRGK